MLTPTLFLRGDSFRNYFACFRPRLVGAALKQEEAQWHRWGYTGEPGSEGAKPGCACVFKQPSSYSSFGRLACTITCVPKPGDQDQKGDQEECLKLPPIMTVLEDASLLYASKLCIATTILLSCVAFPVLVSSKPQGLCRGFSDIAIRSGQGHGTEKGIARLTFERLLCASSSLWL